MGVLKIAVKISLCFLFTTLPVMLATNKQNGTTLRHRSQESFRMGEYSQTGIFDVKTYSTLDLSQHAYILQL